MSLSRPYKFRSSRCLNPWIASDILQNPQKLKSQTVKVLKHISGPLKDGSMVRDVTDGELFIKTVFSQEALQSFYTDLDDCTPPDWNSALLILKKFHIDLEICSSFEKSEYILYVESFILWDLQEGFDRKNKLTHCMEDEKIKERAKEIWTQKKKELTQNDTMDSIPLTQLLEQMTQDSSQGDNVDVDTTHYRGKDKPKMKPQDYLMRPLVIEEFLIDKKEENMLNNIKEWQEGYKPSLSDKDSSVNTPEMDPAQPTLRDGRLREPRQENDQKSDKTEINEKTTNPSVQSQDLVINTEPEKVSLDEAEKLLNEMEQESGDRSVDDMESIKLSCSDPSNASRENRIIQDSKAELSVISENNKLVSKDTDLTSDILAVDEIIQNEFEVKSDCLKNKTSEKSSLCIAPNHEQKRSETFGKSTCENGEAKRDKVTFENLDNTSNSGPFYSYPETQEFIPSKSPLSDDVKASSVSAGTQEFVPQLIEPVTSNQIELYELGTQPFIPQRYPEDDSNNNTQHTCSDKFSFDNSISNADSTSKDDDVNSPLLYEDSHEKMEVIDIQQNVEEQIKYLAIPVGKVIGTDLTEDKESTDKMELVSNHGDMCAMRSGCKSAKEKIINDQDEENRLQFMATAWGDNSSISHDFEESFRLDSISGLEKVKKRAADEINNDNSSKSDDGENQTKRRKLTISAIEERGVSDMDFYDSRKKTEDSGLSKINEKDGDQTRVRRSSSRFTIVMNKVLGLIGMTPEKEVKSPRAQENCSTNVGMEKTDDIMDISDTQQDLQSEILPIITSTSDGIEQKKQQFESELCKDNTNLDDTATQDQLNLSENLLTSYQPQLEDSNQTLSPDTQIDKAELIARLTDMEAPTAIGEQLLNIKFPSHILEGIGRCYFNT